MNKEEADMFSDNFASPEDKNDKEYFPSQSSSEIKTDSCQEESSQHFKVGTFI